ncbi:MAG: helix-turn-helix transcriptional regulator [Paenibacillus macerans]|uniref:helix-turn-helix domain-containing protein n=1 Tax=Paenibacillus TaxID=44249 RepID=UPI00290C894F|nr:helix-turn-helix transcriptional regulator [Paenibacillus macerans]MDU7472097.1 helix-turn-helix transcriptional regulator [Paenibacillus macerans]
MARTVVSRVGEILKRRGMTQLQLAEKAELRPSTISEIVRDSRTVINKEHLAKIADALEVDDISELIVLEKE